MPTPAQSCQIAPAPPDRLRRKPNTTTNTQRPSPVGASPADPMHAAVRVTAERTWCNSRQVLWRPRQGFPQVTEPDGPWSGRPEPDDSRQPTARDRALERSGSARPAARVSRGSPRQQSTRPAGDEERRYFFLGPPNSGWPLSLPRSLIPGRGGPVSAGLTTANRIECHARHPKK